MQLSRMQHMHMIFMQLVLFVTLFTTRSWRLHFAHLVQLVCFQQDDCCAQRLQLAALAILLFFPLQAVTLSVCPLCLLMQGCIYCDACPSSGGSNAYRVGAQQTVSRYFVTWQTS
jgi:hypothetical protein